MNTSANKSKRPRKSKPKPTAGYWDNLIVDAQFNFVNQHPCGCVRIGRTYFACAGHDAIFWNALVKRPK